MTRSQQIKNELDKTSNAMYLRRMALKTRKVYLHWLKCYISWVIENPAGSSNHKISGYLTHLAKDKYVAVATQRQALNAIVFYYKQVRKLEIGDLNFKMASKPKKLPVVLSVEEVQRLRDHLKGLPWLAASIMYGCGLRLEECLSLRIKDIDFDREQIKVCAGKREKDRSLRLPTPLVLPIENQIEESKRRF